MERKEKEKEIRRNDIIEAAEKVFFSKGYESATMDDVAKMAEFSKRTVYVYFNSKEQIYFEIMLRGYQFLNDMLVAEFENEEEKSSLDRIRQIGRTLFTFSNEYPDYFKAIMEYENGEFDFDKGIPDQSREECYLQGEKIFGYLIRFLNKGMEENTIRSDIDTVSTALVLWACTIGVFKTVKTKANYIRHYHNKSSEQLITDAFDMLIRSIQP